MSYNFELRLNALGECVLKLSKETKTLQNLFDICLSDYIESKQEIMNNYHSKDTNIKDEISSNIHNLEDQIPPPYTETEKNETFIDQNIKSELEINRDHILPKLKRGTPEELYSSYASEGSITFYNSNKYPQNTNKTLPISKNNSRRIKYDAIFSIISHEEKERILYDNTILGIGQVERKWGVDCRVLKNFENSSSLNGVFNNEESKNNWMNIQYNKIEVRMRNLILKDVVQNINKILHTNKSPRFLKIITLQDLYKLAFDRGIAIASSRYRVNLFDLEFVLREDCKGKWGEMERNKWYNVNVDEMECSRNLSYDEKLEIAKLSEVDGVMYTCKRVGICKKTLAKYRKLIFQGGK